MFINCLLLAISVSIDSLGIGITYGIKNTYLSHRSKIILIVISLVITNIAIYFGEAIKYALAPNVCTFLGTAILICMGFYIIYSSISSPEKTYDFDNSKNIDEKEALVLGLALSLDAFCVGFGGSIAEVGFGLFPLLVAGFQILFLSLGTSVGKTINSLTKLPNNMWSVISGILLVGIGFSRLII